MRYVINSMWCIEQCLIQFFDIVGGLSLGHSRHWNRSLQWYFLFDDNAIGFPTRGFFDGDPIAFRPRVIFDGDSIAFRPRVFFMTPRPLLPIRTILQKIYQQEQYYRRYINKNNITEDLSISTILQKLHLYLVRTILQKIYQHYRRLSSVILQKIYLYAQYYRRFIYTYNITQD